MKYTLFLIIIILTLYFIDKTETCYLNNKICIFEFNYSNSVERQLYLKKSISNPDEKNIWRNTHDIHPKGLNGYWNNCKKISEKTIICSFQALVNIPKCTPYNIDRYPIDHWNLKFFSITLLNQDQYKIVPYRDKEIPWMKNQEVNIAQEVLCDEVS